MVNVFHLLAGKFAHSAYESLAVDRTNLIESNDGIHVQSTITGSKRHLKRIGMLQR